MDQEVSWYIEGDGFTNEALAAELAKRNEGTPEKQDIIVDSNGQEHDVWVVHPSFIRHLQNNKKAFPFKFKVFKKVGNGVPQEWKLHEKKNPSRKTVRAMEDLKEIQERRAKGAGSG